MQNKANFCHSMQCNVFALKLSEAYKTYIYLGQYFGILPVMPLVPGYPCSVPGYPWSVPSYPRSVPACPESVPGCP